MFKFIFNLIETIFLKKGKSIGAKVTIKFPADRNDKVEDILKNWNELKKNSLLWTKVIWHHTYSTDGNELNYPAIERYHKSYRIDGVIVTKEEFEKRKKNNEGKLFEKPFDFIGYHFVIEKLSNAIYLHVGRPLSVIGAHTVGENLKAIGCAVVGNYDKQELEKDKFDFCIKFAKEINRHFGFTADNHYYHNQFSQKSCPGKLFPDIAEFRSLIRSKI